MPLDLLKRTEKGAPITAGENDANMTAIEGAVGTLESDVTALQTAAATQGTNAREWSADTASQAQAEDSTNTVRYAFTPQRVWQAIRRALGGVSVANTPTAGQVLKATSATTAEWGTDNAGVGAGSTNLSWVPSPTGGLVVSDSGDDASITLADGTNAGLMSPANSSKLAGIAAGATANLPDAQLLDRTLHTGFQPISTVTGLSSALDAKLDNSQLGAANGAAPLGADLRVPAIHLPGVVPEIVEVANLAALPATGVGSRLYIAIDTNRQYRWAGSAYAEIVASPGSTDAVSEGSVNLYHTPARVRATDLTGINLADTAAVTATSTVLQAIGRLWERVSRLGTAAFTPSGDYATAAQGVDSREWSAATATQAEAENASSTVRRAFTAQRIWQAITKALGGVAVSNTPTAGQSLVATSTTQAAWTTVSGTASPIARYSVRGVADNVNLVNGINVLPIGSLVSSDTVVGGQHVAFEHDPLGLRSGNVLTLTKTALYRVHVMAIHTANPLVGANTQETSGTSRVGLRLAGTSVEWVGPDETSGLPDQNMGFYDRNIGAGTTVELVVNATSAATGEDFYVSLVVEELPANNAIPSGTVLPSATLPLPNGAASAGSGSEYSLGNHVHPEAPTAPAWAAGETIAAGVLRFVSSVLGSSAVFRAVSAHTANATVFTTDLAAGRWTLVSQGLVAPNFVSLNYYPANFLFKGPRGNVYRTILAHTSEASFNNAANSTRFELHERLVTLPWAASELYLQGETVTHGSQTLERVSSGLAGATLDGTEAVAWRVVAITAAGASIPAPTWVAGETITTGMLRHATGHGSTGLWRATTNHTANATAFSTDIANWSPVDTAIASSITVSVLYPLGFRARNPNGNVVIVRAAGTMPASYNNAATASIWELDSRLVATTWAASTLYLAGEWTINASGFIYERITSGLSGASFDATEAAAWRVVKAPAVPAWATGEVISAGDLRSTAIGGAAVVLRANGAHTSGTLATDLGNGRWLLDSQQVPVSSIANNTFYPAGLLVTNAIGNVLRVLTGHTTTAAYNDATNSNKYALHTRTVAPAWAASTLYFPGEWVTSGALTLERISAALSRASFDATELAAWRVVRDTTVATTAVNGLMSSAQVTTLNNRRGNADTYVALTWASSFSIDFNALTGGIGLLTLGGTTTFTTVNLAQGRNATVIISAGASSRTVTLPALDWQSSTPPTTIPANKRLTVTMNSTGSTNADVVASWSLSV